MFASVRAAAAAVAVLLDRAARTVMPVYGYCVMPDHAHLVIGPSQGCDIITFIAQFKNLVQREVWDLGVEGRLWQRGFYDHFLRADEQLERVVDYVRDNPVRAGLVQARGDYPYSGSLVREQ